MPNYLVAYLQDPSQLILDSPLVVEVHQRFCLVLSNPFQLHALGVRPANQYVYVYIYIHTSHSKIYNISNIVTKNSKIGNKKIE